MKQHFLNINFVREDVLISDKSRAGLLYSY